jgi:para-aminobenzoate synthetase component 1
MVRQKFDSASLANKNSLDWINPVELARKISSNYDKDWIFLYSGLDERFSYLALFPLQKIISDNFEEAKSLVENSQKKWFGYFSYEVGRDFENFTQTTRSVINLPKIWLINFKLIFEFDHKLQRLTAITEDKKLISEVLNWKSDSALNHQIKCQKLSSNFTDESYLKTIEQIKESIARGDLYQTNLTRKFFGKFDQKQNQQSAFSIFENLAKASPANYSSFLSFDKNFIISSSPELFFKVKNRSIISRPIKGTAPRGASQKEDKNNKLKLKNSLKEQAENLMIVDLVRNDLARICKAGSVKVRKLFKITSYKNIHHMSSEIWGILDQKYQIVDALRALFPPGSMTGAPKIMAMDLAAKNEKIDRGVYSGSIGFFDKKTANFSVVIRTLLVRQDIFEFQVGGAITYDSNPQKELEEIYSKARALMNVTDAVNRKIAN